MLSRTFYFSFFLILLSACGKEGEKERWTLHPERLPSLGKPREKSYQALFYNCENLFDTDNTVGVEDDAHTPEGAYEWDEERYQKKLDRIAKVIGDYASSPDLVGLCEIENAKPLKELLTRSRLATKNYAFLHHQSRDPRGIDLALLFDPQLFHPYEKKAHPITDPGSGRPSRPILSLGMRSASGDSIRIFLCHWPSRAGGKKASEPARLKASETLQDALSELHQDHPSRKVLIMGDLNDHPPDPSVRTLINGDHGYELKDLLRKAHHSGKGTYNFQGDWGVLDHFIANAKLMNAASGIRYHEGSARILRRKELLFYDQKGGHYQPDRYMEKGTYYGGYSDHLPILLELE